ncbi:MAG: bifunctional 23S rRNA (guanine(2069)-N(7))-methyltransferase RlmK/23S rRNA (guanine(2445)-N(2))-methyltransferase RlmL [Eggerthellaceae bacterium]|nr:bifunctional 23S rRNA (guanine(2069)-N(7))-methyltransferase RlmK/23S rRNA (guanine(2445)-N(2))-methyltransferase RlmL [Eggerthellaceae bacterium]
MSETYEFFARCASGLEALLASELKRLGISRIRPLSGGVVFFCGLEGAYRACLWSRVASRVLLVLGRFDAQDAEALYRGVQSIDWERHIAPGATLAVTALGTNDALRNTQFTAVKTKDAVCDQLRAARGARPDVQVPRPDVSIVVSLRGAGASAAGAAAAGAGAAASGAGRAAKAEKQAKSAKASISIDLSGEPLHRRGYREQGKQAAAPLKEALAAGIVLDSGWEALVFGAAGAAAMPAKADAAGAAAMPAKADAADVADKADAPRPADAKAQPDLAFLDPMCGSGTLVIEAAMVAADMAPGIARDYWGFNGWAGHDRGLWESLIDEADQRLARGLGQMPRILGCDIDPEAVALSKANARRAGLAGHVEFFVHDVARLGELVGGLPTGLIVTNPPYGERLSSPQELPKLYASLARGLDGLPPGWRLSVITPDESIDRALGYKPFAKTELYNGPLKAALRHYRIDEADRSAVLLTGAASSQPLSVAVLEQNSAQFAARLKKVAALRRKWARRAGVSSYRVYDADLPDYAVAIDYFEGVGPSAGKAYLTITEYAPPKTVDEDRAKRRFGDVLALAPRVLGVPEAQVFAKQRVRDKGGGQYRDQQGSAYHACIGEGGYRFELDFGARLDTGIFLDHRLTRQLVGDRATGTRFLNLFAYTGTASVYAAGGGAKTTTTVDLSQTYLAWARRNMGLNGFTGDEHRFVRADVAEWLDAQAEADVAFDLVFADPPTFSNSKAMGDATWSVQRDHVALLARIARVLAPGGTAVFSCNLKNFKPDIPALREKGIKLTDITPQTIPEDFKRSPKIHHCYIMTQGAV